MSLKSLIQYDIENIFLNIADFCDNITLQLGPTKFNIIGSLQSNTIQNNSGNDNPLQENSYTLYIKYPIENKELYSKLSAGTRLMINDRSFSVVSISDEMGIATIQLKTHIGR